MVKTRRTLKEVNQEQEVMILNQVELALMWCMRVSCLWLGVIVLMRSCTAAMSRLSVGKHSIPTRVEIHFHISKMKVLPNFAVLPSQWPTRAVLFTVAFGQDVRSRWSCRRVL